MNNQGVGPTTVRPRRGVRGYAVSCGEVLKSVLTPATSDSLTQTTKNDNQIVTLAIYAFVLVENMANSGTIAAQFVWDEAGFVGTLVLPRSNQPDESIN